MLLFVYPKCVCVSLFPTASASTLTENAVKWRLLHRQRQKLGHVTAPISLHHSFTSAENSEVGTPERIETESERSKDSKALSTKHAKWNQASRFARESPERKNGWISGLQGA